MNKPSSSAYDFLGPPMQPGDLGTLGAYRILGELGKGGMGFVFRAEDTVLKRSVALKVMNKKIAATPHARDRFIEEARAMAAVHQDNVVVIFEVGFHEETPFMAMEMLEGETLEQSQIKKVRERKAKGKDVELFYDYETVIRYATQMSRGLRAAHEKGIVHRDIKPANIWLESGNNRIKILDFGLALAQTPVDRLASSGSVVGTPAYLSPEQARSDPLDDRSDLYSLGVVLYELCTGKRPLFSPAVSEQLVAILSHDPKPIRELNPKIPSPLADLIHVLLRKEPSERPETAAKLEKELAKVAVECESKSEVALSLNKLQQSLSEVVSQQSSSELEVVTVVEPEVEVYPDPLPAYPDPLAQVPPATIPPATPMNVARPGMPKAGGKKPVVTTGGTPTWLPTAAVGGGAALLVGVGLIAFMFSGGDPPVQTASVPTTPTVAQPATTNPEPTNPKQPAEQNSATSQKPANQASENSNKKPSNQQRNQGGNRGKGGKGKNNRKNQQNNTAKQNNAKPDKPVDQPAGNAPKEMETMAAKDPVMNRSDSPAPEAMTSTVSMDVPSTAQSNPDSMATDPLMAAIGADIPDPASEVKLDLRIENLSTSSGVGADATVKKAASQKKSFGTDPTLAIQQRAGKDLQHSYIRFDFQSLGKEREKVQKAALQLTLHDRVVPSQASIRVYGLDVPASQIWAEEGPNSIRWHKSFSAGNIAEFPLVAELTPETLAVSRGAIKLTSDELASFVRDSQQPTLTFVITGGQAGNDEPLLFVSREADSLRAPVLTLGLDPNENTK